MNNYLDIYSLVAYVSTLAVTIYLFDGMLDRKRSKRIYFLFFFVLYYIFNKSGDLIRNPYYNAAVLVILDFILIEFFYFGKIRNKIILIITDIVFGIGIEVLFEMLLRYIIRDGYDWANLGQSYRMLIIIAENLLIFAIYRILIIKWGKKAFFDYNIKIYYINLLLVAATIILYVFIIESKLFYYLNNIHKNIIIFLCILFLIINMLSFFVFDSYIAIMKANENYRVEQTRNTILMRFYDRLSEENSKKKKLVHDIKNNLSTLGRLVKEEKYADTISFLKNMDVYINDIGTIYYCSNNILNAVIAEKKDLAIKNGIDNIDIFVEKTLDTCNIDDLDILVIIGNLLDNAIEASLKIDEKKISVNIYNIYNGIVFEVKNRYNGDIIYNNGRFITQKNGKEEHGIGIDSVESCVKKYNGIFDIKIENNIFDVTIIINY